ncbi:MAG: hypothetical protein U0528_04415 [Anaerolineae bacterium]
MLIWIQSTQSAASSTAAMAGASFFAATVSRVMGFLYSVAIQRSRNCADFLDLAIIGGGGWRADQHFFSSGICSGRNAPSSSLDCLC